MPYTDTDDMIKHLHRIFDDPNRIENAKRHYRAHVIRPGHCLSDLPIDFHHYADKTGVPEESQKEDFWTSRGMS